MSLVMNPQRLSVHRAASARVMEILCGQMNKDVPSVDTDLFESGTLDSLAFVSLLAHLEQAFAMTVSVEDLELDNFRSVARIAAFVSRETAGVESDGGAEQRLGPGAAPQPGAAVPQNGRPRD